MFLHSRKWSFYVLLSFGIHFFILLLFTGNPWSQKQKEQIRLKEGISKDSPQLLYSLPLGLGANASPQNNSPLGSRTEREEIEEFQNALSYPELARMQGWEDECKFRVTVAENGGIESLVVVTPCQHPVFEREVRTKLESWKFDTARGKDLILPIRFKLYAGD
ncbi:hypothetical protein LPTSP4_29350 [Leptospira ryugenii]|uniref:TonB C-terminal domain-containing protein n=1 Tax=Leptospira ryugenii TaxID=1917863 RepID=A0A2P2E3H4_9LEPT|nr:TonB family protein [Leptospira ryugenii]GBF51399.1 hypothetical protein LPTSP4_29350 [Leptospira ryugenii]